jgi:hypothetical protein
MKAFEPLIDAVRSIWRKKSLAETMAQELYEAQFAKVRAESAVEYAESIVRYNERRIERLQQRIREEMVAGAEPMVRGDVRRGLIDN